MIACGIEPECFDRFFGAMAMDLTTSRYETWEDLLGYMEGSAAVIGEMMLPVLEPTSPEAKEPARSLGLAFQLTNFLRDVDEDLDRGRVYLPQEDLRAVRGRPAPTRGATPEWRALMAYEIERNRALYAFADTGIAMLPPRSARCVGAARVLYAQILDRIERPGLRRVRRAGPGCPPGARPLTAARIMVTGPRSERRQSRSSTEQRGHMSLRTRIATSGRPVDAARASADPDRPGAAAAGEPDDLVLAAGQAGPDRRRPGGVPGAELRWLVRRRGERRRRPRRSRWPGPSPAARWSSGATPTAAWSPDPAPARTSVR